MPSNDMFISFVVPCYRSENTIESVVDEIIQVSKEQKISRYEIILVCDASPDNVWSVIEDLSKKYCVVKGILLSKNFGQHAALLAGYKASKGDIVVSLDDDGQSPINEVDLLLAELNKGYDVVYAYYDEIKQTRFRRFGTWMAVKMAEIMLGAPKGLKGSSFYAARRFVIDEMTRYKNSYPYLAGLVFRTTHNVSCVMTHQRMRMNGSSGYRFRSLLKLWINGFTAFSVKPLRVGVVFGTFFSVLGFLLAIIVAIRKLLNPGLAAGWPSVFCVILVIGGLILSMLGMLGEYVGRIYISINNSPQYVIRKVTDD